MDILATAIGTADHPGHVRGESKSVVLSSYFGRAPRTTMRGEISEEMMSEIRSHIRSEIRTEMRTEIRAEVMSEVQATMEAMKSQMREEMQLILFSSRKSESTPRAPVDKVCN